MQVLPALATDKERLMQEIPNTAPAASWARPTSLALGVYALVGGLLSLSGWAADLPRLTDWDGNGISIQPNATVAATAAGAALLFLIQGYNRVALLLGVLVALIGGTAILQYVSGVNFGIDTLLMFDRTWGRRGVLFPGRMGPPGAASWTLLGCALVLASSSGFLGWRRTRAFAPPLALATITIASLSIIGYLYGANLLYTIPTLTVIAFQTSTFILAISVGVILAIVEHGPMRLLGEQGPAGTLVRRILPGLIALPILLGFVRLAGERAGLYDLAFGTAARTLTEIVLLLLLLWWTASAVARHTDARIEAEKAREKSAAQLRERARLLDLSNDTIFARDMQDRITYWNQGAADAYGYTREEALGKVTHALLKTEFPEPLERINDVLLREGRWSGELVHTTRDGRTIVDASRWALERDASGQPSAILETNLDITARKQNERHVRENEERLRLAQAVAHIGSFDWNIQKNVNVWSPELEAIYGLKPGEFGGTQAAWEILVHPEDVTAFTAKVDEAFQHGEPVEGEWRIVRPDGSVRWLAGRFQCMKDDQGRPLRLVGVSMDVTERKSMEQERADAEQRLKAALAEADRESRLKDEFLATLSHELRTPMNAIVGWASMLGSGVKKDDIQHGLRVIERNARLQSQIIEDLLDMSRIITGKVRLNVQSVDLTRVVTEALEAVRPAADAKGVRVESICDPRASDVRGDPDRLQQVLYNLLSNAVKFTPRNGKVQVHCQRVNSHVELAVADTGVGIKPEFLPHVFERFRQQDATTVRAFAGLGLGLAIVKQIVELHGGRVHVASQGEGKGATFTVHLPIALALRPPFTPDESSVRQHPAVARVVATDADDAAGPALVDVSSALDGLRVLVVEDDADARDLLRTMLTQHGAQVVLATAGDEALDRLTLDRPDVLLCDIGMPRMDGYEVIAAARKLPASNGGSIAAIALTAFARSEDRVRALQAGFDMHLSKPIETLELVMSIRAATRLRSAERA